MPIAIFSVMALAIGAFSTYQIKNQDVLKKQAVTSNTRFLALKEIDRQLFQMQSRHQSISAEANLYSFIQCKIPTSRIITEVSNRLPRTCEIEDIKILNEARPESNRRSPANRRGTPSNQADEDKALMPAQRDLKELAQEKSAFQRVIIIEGQTTNPTELHRFVESLANASVFTSADLRLLETDSEGYETASFRVRAIVTDIQAIKTQSPSSNNVKDSVAKKQTDSFKGVDG